jgi:hypothetical protein
MRAPTRRPTITSMSTRLLILRPVTAPPAGVAGRTGDVLPATRAGVVFLFVLAIANGVFLYLFPAEAERHYAWPVTPSIGAAVMGAGYLAGCLGSGLAAFAASHFRSFRSVLPGFVVLSATMLAATLVHEDRFRWDYPPTIVWTAVYAAIPIGVGILWRLQEPGGAHREARDPRLRSVAALSAATAAVVGAVGVLLVVAPNFLLHVWPWHLTELMSRVAGGWYLFSAATLAFAAVTVRHPGEVAIPYATVAMWSLLLLPLPALHAGSVDVAAVLAAYLALHVLIATVCLAAMVVALRAIRSR